MFRKKNILIIILTVIVVLVACISAYPQSRPKIAVVGIASTAPGYTWCSNSPFSQEATELMINALLAKHFRVFERAKLDLILQEQGFQNFSGLVDPATAVKLGKMIGVDVIVMEMVN